MSDQEIKAGSVVLVIQGKAMPDLPFFFPATVTELQPGNNFLVRVDGSARDIKVPAGILVKIGDLEDLDMAAMIFLSANRPMAVAVLAREVYNLRRRLKKTETAGATEPAGSAGTPAGTSTP